MGFSKLHSSLVNSSLWTEPDGTRILFITLLAICDRQGVVYGSRDGISRIANIDVDEIDDAWASLLAPDGDSSDRLRNPENEGRRIEEIPGGFRLLNYAYYRGLRNDDDRREQNRAAQERWRGKTTTSASVSQRKPRSARVSLDQPPSAHAEAEADAEEPHTPQPPSRGGGDGRGGSRRIKAPFVKPTPDEVDAYVTKAYPDAINKITGDAFVAFYESKGWVVGKTPMKSWKAAVYTWIARREEQ